MATAFLLFLGPLPLGSGSCQTHSPAGRPTLHLNIQVLGFFGDLWFIGLLLVRSPVFHKSSFPFLDSWLGRGLMS